MKIDIEAYKKIIDHVYKYPSNSCFGYLIGDNQNIKKAIPTLHIWILKPGLELSLSLIQQHISKQEAILGFYFAENISYQENSVFLDVLKKVYLTISKELKQNLPVAIKVDNEALKDTIISQPFKYYNFNEDRQEWNILKEAISEIDLNELNLHLNNKGYLKLNDFDDHLENVKINWLN